MGRFLPVAGLLLGPVSIGIENVFAFVDGACDWRARLAESVFQVASGDSGNAAYASRLIVVFEEGLKAGA